VQLRVLEAVVVLQALAVQHQAMLAEMVGLALHLL
tara:strand:+ start:373 stop:477 length:105 start_codon:yes stop_codon:yes gene_type:complete